MWLPVSSSILLNLKRRKDLNLFNPHSSDAMDFNGTQLERKDNRLPLPKGPFGTFGIKTPSLTVAVSAGALIEPTDLTSTYSLSP